MPLPRSADLGLSDEQKLLRRTLREFAQEKVAPRAHEIDAAQSFPAESWTEAARARPARRDGSERATAAPASA